MNNTNYSFFEFLNSTSNQDVEQYMVFAIGIILIFCVFLAYYTIKLTFFDNNELTSNYQQEFNMNFDIPLPIIRKMKI